MMSWNLAAAVGRRPDLWVEGVRTLFAVSRRNWWRKAPFLPIPDQPYADWRLATAQGDVDSPLPAGDLILYLEWRKKQHRVFGRV
ncbi:MAG: hypothetical protein GY788_10420 [bacterium]|nr:hypothetical protein [bacterium]